MASSAHPLFIRGVEQMRAGHLEEARLSFEAVLRQKPDHFDALTHLAHVESLSARHAEAAEHLLKAARLKKSDAAVRYALAEAYKLAGDFPRAIAAYEKAADLQPHFFEAHCDLGHLLDSLGDTPRALHHMNRANLIRPTDPGPVITMANLLLKVGKTTESLIAGGRAVAMAPQSVIAHINYANALLAAGQTDAAIGQFQIAISCDPSFGPAHSGLGVALETRGDYDQAEIHLRRCVELSPDFPLGWNNLGRVLTLLGRIPEVIALARRALQIRPTLHLWNLLLMSLAYTDTPQEQILREHQKMLEQFPADSDFRPQRAPPANRRIRVGYLSPDFRNHPVAYFLEPLLQHHDRGRFEIFCYPLASKGDQVTQRLQSYPATWRQLDLLADADIRARIEEDKLDILIDLAGHTANNRIGLLLKRLAPLQIEYLGYPTTTGLPTLDVRLTDAIADPPGGDDRFYSERLVRLPGCFCCFHPPAEMPEVAPPPAHRTSEITFGSLHALAKINDRVLDLWANVLHGVPHSRLLIFRNTLTASVQNRLRSAFAARGIDPARLALQNEKPKDGYLSLYNTIDISLDTFPFTGHTTACQSLLMGVPILTLGGDSHRHRLVATVLHYAGLPQFIAGSPGEYVRLAQSLSADLSQLATLRQSLRRRFLASSLCDAPTFARQFESALLALLD